MATLFKSKTLKRSFPYIAVFLANVIWGANFVIAKLTLLEVPVMTLGFLRFFLGFLFMLPFLLFMKKKDRKIKLVDLPTLVVVSILMITFNIALFYEGLLRTTTTTASGLMLIIPIISVFLSWIVFKEKIYLLNLAGIIFALVGAIFLLGSPLLLSTTMNPSTLLGNILVIISAISFVAGSIISKQILRIYPVFLVTVLMFLIGSLTFAIPALMEYLNNPDWIAKLTLSRGVVGIFYIVLLSSISAYFLNNWALSKISVSNANLFQYIEPAVAATFAIPLLGENITFPYIIGILLVVLGVYWGTVGKEEHIHAHHKSHRI